MPDNDFNELIHLSFVGGTARGWQFHDLVRSLVRQDLRDRLPDTYTVYHERAASALSSRIRSKKAAGMDAAWDIYDLISLTGNPILSAHFRHSRSSENYWEQVTEQMLPEVERYIELRRNSGKTLRIACSDIDSGDLFRYELTGEDSLLRFSGWEAKELIRFDGMLCGFSAALTATSSDLPRFIFTVDVIDPEQVGLRTDTVNLVMEHILAGSLLIASPSAIPFFIDSHYSMGFAEVSDIEGTFLEQIAHFRTLEGRQPQNFAQKSNISYTGRFGFTPREHEVAGLLSTGTSNKEIAASLFISEAAVKKHINAMLQKTGFRNRTQIVAALLENPGLQD